MAEPNQDQPQQQQLNIEIAADKAGGVFSNASVVSSGNGEARIDFLYVDRANRQGNQVPAYLVSRVIMTPNELAELNKTLTNHINKHLVPKQ